MTAEIISTADGGEKMVCSTCGQKAPRCYAQMWDPNNPKCRGGADPTHWEGGSHIRPKCSFESRCSAAQDKRNKEHLVPVMNTLTKKPYHSVEVKQASSPQALPTPMSTPVQSPTTMTPHRPVVGNIQTTVVQQPRQMQQPGRVAQQQVVQPRPQAQHPQAGQVHYQHPQAPVPMAYVPPEMAPHPSYVPQNYPSPGMQVPSPLSVPEPYDGNVMKMVAYAGLRTGLKFMLVGMANALDFVPWSTYPVPQSPAPPQNTNGQ
jgi:hypothetical protein